MLPALLEEGKEINRLPTGVDGRLRFLRQPRQTAAPVRIGPLGRIAQFGVKLIAKGINYVSSIVDVADRQIYLGKSCR